MCDSCGWERYHKDLDRLLDGEGLSWRIERELEYLNDRIEGNKHITPAQKYFVDNLVKRGGL